MRSTTWMPDRGGKGFWLVDREMAQAAAPVRLALQEDGSATMASASLFGDSDWVLSPASGRDKLPITGLYQAFWTAPQDRQIDIFGKSAITFVPRTDITGRQMIVRLFESQTSGDLTEIARGSARFEAFPGAQDQAERRIELHTIARQLPAGTRLCVIVSGSLWPAIPPASAADLGDFDLGHISLELPARKEKLQPARPFAAMEKRVRSNQIVLFPPRRSVTSAIIPSTGVRTLRIGGNAGIFDDFVRVRLPDTGMEMQHEVETVHTLDERLGASTSTVTHDFELSRNGWSIGLAGEFSLTTSQAHHELSGRIQARVDGQDIYQKTWQSRTIALGG